MIKKLQIENLRILQQIDLSPTSGINLISGENGAGKTSLLEAIYVLAYGRSFRHREILPLIKEKTTSFRLVTKFTANNDFEHTLGMLRTKNELTIRLNGKSSIRRSEILNLMPITWIGSDPQLLLTAGPEKRRSFLDNGLFHVEHDYLRELQKYQRCLEQRNAALKKASKQVQSWDKLMDESALKIDIWRFNYMQKLTTYITEYMQLWSQPIEVEIRYQRGWSQEMSLLAALQKSIETDKKLKHTTLGSHRADIAIRSQNQKSGKLLSRGQLKMLACAFYFAQARTIKEAKNTSLVLLFDDLAAELDMKNRQHLLSTLDELYDQSFITTLSKEDICYIQQPQKMFHVEHGSIQE